MRAVLCRSIFVILLTLVLQAGDAGEQAEVRRFIEQRELARAEEIVVRHLSANGRSPEWILLLAEIRLDQQRLTESLQLLDGARQLGDASYRNHLLTGLTYVAMRRLDLAEPELRAAVQLDASSAQAAYYLGRLLYAKNAFEEAVSVTKEAIVLDPRMVRAFDNLGLCYEALQKTKEAEQAYLEAIRLQRISAAKIEWPALNLGAMLVKQGSFERAKGFLEEALHINPKSAEAHFRLGAVFEHTANLSRATAEYKEAIACDPKLSGAYYRLAQVYRRMGRRKDADALLHLFQERK